MFAVVTDSAAYFTKQEAVRLGVTVIPMNYSIAGAKFDEHYADENVDFLKVIKARAAECKTSQPNVLAYEAVLRRIVESGHEVILISASSRLSGAYNSAMMAHDSIANPKLHIFDSMTIAGGQRLIVEEAVRLSGTGIPLKSAIKELTEYRAKVGTVFSVEKMDALRRGGRVGAVKLSLGNLLNVRPILEIKDGAVIGKGTARGIRNLIKELVSCVPVSAKKIILMSIFSAESAKMMQPIALEYLISDNKIEYQSIGPVLAIHLGDGAFGIAWSE